MENDQNPNEPSNPTPSSPQQPDSLYNLIRQYNKKVKLSVAISSAGILFFLIIAIVFPLRDKFFGNLFPKQKSQAAVCTSGSLVPKISDGFVYTGGDLGQIVAELNTPLYYTFDNSFAQGKHVYMVGRYSSNFTDPSGLQTLMENDLSNSEFKGLWGQSPVGWKFITAGRSGEVGIDTAPENSIKGRNSVKIANKKSPSGSQIIQSFKKNVQSGNLVLFGAWVKAASPSAVKVFIQNTKDPYEEFGVTQSQIEPNQWTFIQGYGKVPQGVDNFQLAMRVVEPDNAAWFSGAVAIVIDGVANQTISDMVLRRCGSAWLIDNEPGWEGTYSAPLMKPLSSDIYALIYYQYYNAIKSVDPSAQVIPGGLAGAPITFDVAQNNYSPKSFLDNWRASYKKFFNTEPPIDALSIHYIAADQTSWNGASDFKSYMSKVRSYINDIPDWRGKPIWITKLGVVKSASNGGTGFARAVINFLADNNLGIEKWFWFDTCGVSNNVASLFISNNKICSWPMELSALGKIYLSQNPVATKVPSISPSTVPSTVSATIVPTVASTPTPVPTLTLAPTQTATATPTLTITTVPEGTGSGNIP